MDEPERRAFVTGWPYPFRPERADLLRDEEVGEVRDRERAREGVDVRGGFRRDEGLREADSVVFANARRSDKEYI
jgi:hypothetical protein